MRCFIWYSFLQNFYPRPPRGGRRRDALCLVLEAVISIHALREEGDASTLTLVSPKLNFYPRPPRGGRPGLGGHSEVNLNFYPRPPRGGRQVVSRCGIKSIIISIHALREEGDSRATTIRCALPYFYPRPPRGGRRSPWKSLTFPRYFYPRPPRGGRRAAAEIESRAPNYFYPRPPRGGRPEKYRDTQAIIEFLSTPSARRATLCLPLLRGEQGISIHALREEGDEPHGLLHRRGAHFYPRPPRGGRHKDPELFMEYYEFLSTPSARRATTSWV